MLKLKTHSGFHDLFLKYISAAIILCLHVFIARRILLILDMLIIFSEYSDIISDDFRISLVISSRVAVLA
jgi:hypothetical protein